MTGRGFKPGQSGNPGGRPAAIKEVRDLAREQTDGAIRALVHVMEAGKSESARVAAAQALLDRGWGRPTQALEHSGPGGSPLIDLGKLTDRELEALERIYEKAMVPDEL